MKHAHKVNMSFKYTGSSSTDIRKSIARERARLTAVEDALKAEVIAKVRQIKVVAK
jgi:hypothetical protein